MMIAQSFQTAWAVLINEQCHCEKVYGLSYRNSVVVLRELEDALTAESRKEVLAISTHQA